MSMSKHIKKVVCLLLVLSLMLQCGPLVVFATDGTETSEPHEAESTHVVCTCGTDDAAYHATNCAVYVAPEEAVCSCAEKCAAANVWCDVCGVDYAACTGADAAVVYATSGTCGDNLTWELDDNYVLTISGSGPMTDFGSVDDVPWYGWCGDLQRVMIDNGVTSIGRLAFLGCSSLMEVTIPESVTAIADNAFDSCSSLTEINIPNSVTSIGMAAFRACSKLTKIKIPVGITSIGIGAFMSCSGLKEIHIPNSVTSIGLYAFYDCSSLTDVYFAGTREQWSAITVEESNDPLKNATVHCVDSCDGRHSYVDNVCSVCGMIGGTCGDNLTWELDENYVLTISGTGPMADYTYAEDVPWYSWREDLLKVVIEEGVTSIGDGAFYDCDSLTEVTIPENVTNIGKDAFRECNGLKEITIPESVTSIGECAFFYCNSLTKINIPSGVTILEDGLFIECQSLNEIDIPNGVTSIGEYAFSGCRNLTVITIPESITSIGEEAFSYSGLTEVTITNKITKIGDYAFYACSSLMDVYFIGTEKQWNAIEVGESNDVLKNATVHYIDPCENGHSFVDNICSGCGLIGGQCGATVYWEYDGNGTITITGSGKMDKFTLVDTPWEVYKSEITTVVIEEGVTEVGDNAFGGYIKLTNVSLPETLVRIGANCFQLCNALKEIYLPDSLQEIGSFAFSYSGVQSIHLGSAVQSLGTMNPFDHSRGLKQITVDEGNPYLCAVENVLFSKDMTKLYCYPAGLTQEYYNVPEGVTTIGYEAFNGNTHLQVLVLPETAVKWEEYAFHGCGKLRELNLPYGLTEIPSMALTHTALEYIVIPDTVKSIGNLAMPSCTLIFEGDLPKIHAGAFGQTTNPRTITAYYPADNATWTADALQNYGGIVTWKPYCYTHNMGDPVTEGSNTRQSCIFCGYTEHSLHTEGGIVKMEVYYQPDCKVTAEYVHPEDERFALIEKALNAPGMVNQAILNVFDLQMTNADGIQVDADEDVSIYLPLRNEDEGLYYVYRVDADATLNETIARQVDKHMVFEALQLGLYVVVEKNHEHIYRIEIVSPGCDTKGYTAHICEKCSARYITDEVAALGHNYENGNCTNCGIADPDFLRITSQPVSYVGAVNDEVPFVVEATGTDLTYEWYYTNNGGRTWVKSYSPGYETNTLKPIMRAYRDGNMYKCVVSDALGNKVESDVVSMSVKASEVMITSQPVNVENAVLNQLYQFTVEATGDNLTYRWELSTDGGETWAESWNQGYNSATLNVRMNANRDGNLYRCVITSGLKIVKISEPALLDLQDPSVKITGQPGNVFAVANQTVSFHVDAEGTDLTYEWYRSDDKGATWTKTYLTGYDTDSLNFVANANRAAMFACKVTDGSGTAEWSAYAKLQLISSELAIVSQPENVTCASGETAAFTVAAKGDNLKYLWYASADGGATWTITYLGGYNTDTLSFTVNASRAAKLYKCVITDVTGNTVETNAVSVTVS